MKNDYTLSKKSLNASEISLPFAFIIMALAFANEAHSRTHQIKAGEFLNLTVPGAKYKHEYRAQLSYPLTSFYMITILKGGNLKIPITITNATDSALVNMRPLIIYRLIASAKFPAGDVTNKNSIIAYDAGRCPTRH